MAGIAHPQYKTGRYGMDLGESKAKALDRLLTDEELLRLDDNIALLDLRIVDLVSSLTEGGNPAQMWKQAFKYWDLMWRATARGDSDAVAKHRNELDDILRTGIREIATWDEIQDRSEARRKLTDSEVRRREKMQYLVMVEDTLRDYMMMGREIKLAVLDAEIPKEIKVQLLKRIQGGFARHMQISIAQGTESDSD